MRKDYEEQDEHLSQGREASGRWPDSQGSCGVRDFDEPQAVKNFNLDIARGDFVAIMGPRGCGKTTTLRMLAVLERPFAGCISRDGKAIDDNPPWLRRMLLIWRNYTLFPFLTVLDNVEFGLRNDDVSKMERHRRSPEWLERLGIGDLAQRSPETLSGDQAQRVAPARALVLEAKDGQEIKVQLQQRALQDLKLRTNEEVRLTLDQQETLIIPAS